MIKVYYLLPTGEKIEDFSKLSKEDQDLFLIKPSPQKIGELVKAITMLTPPNKNCDIVFTVTGNINVSPPY